VGDIEAQARVKYAAKALAASERNVSGWANADHGIVVFGTGLALLTDDQTPAKEMSR
jgi:hypothetical protein